ncbi:LPS-assembly protein LptD [Alcaligenaceae bacterium CGII-47]|nr:LPS-assembly protein LptD [Alcaligenaceae bacterium CGII-47]
MVGSLRLHSRVDDNALPAFLIGDSVRSDEQNRVILTGHAQVRRIDSVVKGDRIEYDRDSGDLDVQGNGLMMRDGSIVTGTHLRYNINAETGQIEAPSFWLGAKGGAGTAGQAEILSRDHLRLHKVQYSGCPCPDPAWYIRSSRMDLYTSENEGVARNGVLYFKDVPILYSPYLTFPLTKERKSGFLLPTYGTSSNSGFEATLPYYLNLAPNYDATIIPRYMSKRGVQLGAEFRYLGERYHGQAFGTYVMRDQQTQTNRWLYSIQHDQYLGNGFNANVDLRRVSDDNYFRDFSTFGLNDAAVAYLPSQATLSWGGSRYFSSSLQVYRYQTLQDSTGSFLTPPYDKLPELYVRAQHYDWHGLDVVSDNYATRFVSPLYGGDAFPSQSGVRQLPNGTRFSSYTSISRPFVLPGAYLTPKVGLQMSQYDTEWFSNDLPQYASRSSAQSRVVPIMSVDSGLTFERQTSLFGNDAIQTLEPRAYYLYVPYRDQSMLPVFDTGYATFNFAQAFDENIFSGSDRIANANQLTVGLTSRWLDADNGFERLTLSAAQRLYFEDQRVALGNEALRVDAKSDYLFGANAALTDKFSIYFDGQFNPQTRQRNRMSSGMRWSPKRLATVSLSYRYERDPNLYFTPYQSQSITNSALASREQVSISGQWPLSQRWYGVGRYDYSLQEKRSTQSILGLEYKGDCCWAARVVMQRYAVSTEQVNTAVFLQLELTGLGSLGTDPMSLLSDRITDYEPVSPPIPEKTAFERYE